MRRVAAGGSALDAKVIQRMVGRRRDTRPLDGEITSTPNEAASTSPVAVTDGPAVRRAIVAASRPSRPVDGHRQR